MAALQKQFQNKRFSTDEDHRTMSHPYSLQESFDWVLKSTQANGSRNRFMGHCPAHDDRKPSLSIALKDDRILLNCFAGCSLKSILQGLGMTERDLFFESQDYAPNVTHRLTSTSEEKLRYQEVCRYEYQQKDGTPQFCVIRKEATNAERNQQKKFIQSGFDSKGAPTWNMEGVKRIPYKLPELLQAIAKEQIILFVEGEKDVDTAQKLGLIATTLPSGAKKTGGEKMADECLHWLKGSDVVLCPDNDDTGKQWQQMIGNKLIPFAKRIRWLNLPNLQSKEDLSDWVAKGGSRDQLIELIQKSPLFKPKKNYSKELTSSTLRAFPLGEFLAMSLPKRSCLLEPWLPEKGLAMIFAQRGIGKTWFAQQIALCVAGGSSFLRWHCPKPRSVLFIDGEMPLSELQARFKSLSASSSAKQLRELPLEILAADFQELGIPDLASEEGQSQLEPFIDKADLVVVDSISTLVRSGKENEAESWAPIQDWGLRQRAKGKTILFIHHAGKSGAQRGSSKKEDVMDTVIELKPPDDYSPNEGAHYEVHFSKARGFCGEDANPFDLQLQTDSLGNLQWTSKNLEQSTFEKVVEGRKEGLKQTDIGDRLGITKQAVNKHVQKAEAAGLC